MMNRVFPFSLRPFIMRATSFICLKSAPTEATVLREGRLPVEDHITGEIFLVSPGERIGMDGVVSSGLSAVDQAAITGESIPVEKGPENTVYAGTVNQHGILKIEVTRIAADSTFYKLCIWWKKPRPEKPLLSN